MPAANPKRRAKIVEAYRGGYTLRQCGELFGISMQRVQQVISTDAPEILRPKHVVPKPRRRNHVSGKNKPLREARQ